MKINIIFHLKNLYIFFAFLSLIIFFFSTAKVQAKSFKINNIEISRPFEMDFSKNEVIDEGFQKAFNELTSLIIKSSDKKKIQKIELNEIKGMVESFTIKEEKFVDQIYYLNLGVSFNKRKVYKFLEFKNIFPSVPKKKKFLFIPIIIDEKNKDLLLYSKNSFFSEWNNYNKSYDLIEYILPTEDLEDLNLIKEKYEFIEKYDFREITDKYNLEDSIVSLIFINQNEARVLSRITMKNNTTLKNQSFFDIDFENIEKIGEMIETLKIIYEDHWKNYNLINTSVKYPLMVKVGSSNNTKISEFEKLLKKTDLVYNFYISKFDKDFVYFQIVFNGTPDVFLKTMVENNYDFNTQNKIWSLK